MREIRLFVTVLVMSILIVPLIGCSKKENKDEQQQDATTAPQSAAPAQHQVVLIVHDFLKAIDSGDYDHAIGLGTPNEFNQEGLIQVNEAFDFSNVEIVEAYVGNENAAVLTNSISTAAATVQIGLSLVTSDNNWLIRDVDMLPNNEKVLQWLAGFKNVEPNAERVAGSD